MLDLNDFPAYFTQYRWDSKRHALFGYPDDRHPEFRWIADLERRSAWLKTAQAAGHVGSGLHLLKDIIAWGGGQNSRLQKFEDRLGEYCLQDVMHNVIGSMWAPDQAIRATAGLRGLGLTYRSKVLRFLDPVRFGALDRRLRKAFKVYMPHDSRLANLPKIDDTEAGVVKGYIWFCGFVDDIVQELEIVQIPRPACELSVAPAPSQTGWRAADVEMALFQWALGVKA